MSQRTTTRRRFASDDGSALVEFCVLAVLMLVPVVYLVATLGRLQAGAFATQGAAREAARAFVTAPDEATGRERADVAAAVALQDQGFADPSRAQVDISCDPEPCLAAGSRVVVRTTLRVGLPAVPALVSSVVPTSIVVRADHVTTVGRFER